MQNSHYDQTVYQAGLYGASSGYDAGTIKLHHGHYADADTCYSNYSGNNSANFISREPPSYADSTLFHHGFPSNASHSYYKIPSRPTDLPEYGTQREPEQIAFRVDPSIEGPEEYRPRYPSNDAKAISEIDAGSVKIEGLKLEHESDGFGTDLSSSVLTEPLSETAANEDPLSQMQEGDLGQAKEKFNDDAESQTQDKDDALKTSPDVKPTLSYIALIGKAILESSQKRLNLGSIYNWIETNYPYYLNRGQGWRNSVRHNLSLNDCFIKAGRCEDGKGNYWAIHPANIQDFMRGDFRQRRRSRRRGRKKDGDFGMYPMTNGYLGSAAGSALNPGMTFNPPPTVYSSIYSPYTEAERRAYRLDEALLRQSIGNPFMKWCHNGGCSSAPTGTSCNSNVYGGASCQWQGYSDNSSQPVYQLNSSFSSTAPCHFAPPSRLHSVISAAFLNSSPLVDLSVFSHGARGLRRNLLGRDHAGTRLLAEQSASPSSLSRRLGLDQLLSPTLSSVDDN
ncbi:forkhead box protein D4-like [Gigantopelta aegis]|uniref:forkhead box protein D4-like n=1 Tax=Gigantopelta aegis TaxID=1735272 RepID=UPI001B88ADE6|nr:forkhead box protein D4-like [Gigantopelta aegis]